ncbi:MAG: hypothetical protein U9O24_08655 [Campylobacterota bacterium]|nr:hypothetical protein [Campylobacterota bacterium]
MKKVLVTLGLAVVFSTSSVMAVTAGTVNGISISVEEANKAITSLSKGKMTWKKLSKEEKLQLIKMMSPSKLVAASAKKSLTVKEKEVAYSNFWMQKKIADVKISDEKAKKAYDGMKKTAKKKLPAFEVAKASIKMQLAQEEVVGKLMKKAKIKLK